MLQVVKLPESTTIMVKEDVLQALRRLRKELRAESYDEVLRIIIRRFKSLDRSHFGTLPELKPFKREEIDRFD